MRGELSLFIFATEDRERILNSISKVLNLPLEVIRRESVSQTLTGHFKYPIEYLKLPLNEEKCMKIVKTIAEKLPEADKALIFERLGALTDKKSALYIRLDKQGICLGKLTPSDSDPIRIVVKGDKGEMERLIRGLRNV